jgi:hypothetical protein
MSEETELKDDINKVLEERRMLVNAANKSNSNATGACLTVMFYTFLTISQLVIIGLLVKLCLN